MRSFSEWFSGGNSRSAQERRRAAARRRLWQPERLEERRVLAIATQLVKDINNGTFTDGSNPYNYVEVGTDTYFIANTPSSGAEIWKTDGTSGGTTLLKEIAPGGTGSYPRSLTNVNGTLFFSTYNIANGRSELWTSDGTETGTQSISVADSEFSVGFTNTFVHDNGVVYFPARGDGGYELWKSDGTSLGTVRVADIRTGTESSYPSNFTFVNGTLFFSAFSATGGNELWRSNGTAAGTVRVKDIQAGSYGSYPFNFANVNGTLFFSARDADGGQEPWKSDGTASGTVRVADLVPGPGGSYPERIVNVNGIAYFTAYEPNFAARGLWKSGGTPASTVRIEDNSGPVNPSFDGGLVNVGNTLYFVADNAGTPYLYKTNGTVAGTTRVNDSGGTLELGFSTQLTRVGTRIYFVGRTATTGYELWRTDGTAANTVLVEDANPGVASSYPSSLTNIGGRLYYSAQDDAHGAEPWISNGTAATTNLLSDLNTSVASNSAPRYLTEVNGVVYFSATDTTGGIELWKSNGTAAGTVRVKDINPGVGSSYPAGLINVGGTLYFTAYDDAGGHELWKSDGTAAGTVRVRNVYPGQSGSYPSLLTNVNGTLYFIATHPTFGRELWKTNGTSPGTVLVADLNPGNLGIYPSVLSNISGTLLFNPSVNGQGSELWKTDGTAAGTTLVKDIFPGASGSYPGGGGFIIFDTPPSTSNPIRPPPIFFANSGIVEMNGIAYFGATDGEAGLELWRSDGTAAGTYRVEDLEPGPASAQISYLTNVNGTLFFNATDSASGAELWKSDGTLLGTQKVRDIVGGTTSSYPRNLYNFGGTLFFSAANPANGTELWKSDGTFDGTTRIRDIFSGADGSYPGSFTELDGVLFFTARESAFGNELWQTDGTTTGTRRVLDIYTGSTSSEPRYLTTAGGTLFFAANNGTLGVELWRTVVLNDPPTLVANTGFTTFIGGGHFVSSTELRTTDLNQSPTELVYTIVTPPGSGQLELAANPGVAISTFTQDDLDQSRVVYRHNGLPGTSDSFAFTLADGAGGTLPATTVNITLRVATNAATPVLSTNGNNGQIAFFTRAENAPLGITATATDADLPNDALIFSLVTNPADPFFAPDVATVRIDPRTGVITFLPGFGDYENPLDDGGDNLYEFSIQVTDEGGQTDKQLIAITINDANDAPVFSTPEQIFVAENSPTVVQFTATDVDQPAQKITYNLVPGFDSNDFSIDPNTGVLRYRGLGTGNKLDFEDPSDADQDNVYVIEVQASDGRGQTTSQQFSIVITPRNEFAPQFTVPLDYDINENSFGPHIFLAGSDRDFNEPGQFLSFHLAGGPDAGDFTLDPLTGILSFVSTPDREAPADADGDNIYSFDIELRDNATTNPRSVTRTFTIRVQPEQDNAPVFVSLGGGDTASVTVPENQQQVATLHADDADNPSEEPVYVIVGGADANHFFLDPVTGVLTFRERPNFEQPGDANADGTYEIVVHALDGGGLFDEQAITITLSNVNDPPVISSNGGGSSAAVKVPENTTAVTVVVADDEEGSVVQYFITGGADRAFFSINKFSGSLVFKTAPDYETELDADSDGTYEVLVEARDAQGVATTQLLRVDVLDVRRPTVSASVNGAGQIVIRDTANVDNQFRWSRVGSNYLFSDGSTDPDSQIEATGLNGTSVSSNGKTLTIPVATVQATRKPLLIQTGSGDDVLELDSRNQLRDSLVPGFGLTLDLGVGSDTLDLVNLSTNNQWTFNANDTGRVALGTLGSVNFSNVEIADGGSGVDTFRFPASGRLGVYEVRGSSANDPGVSAKLDSIHVSRNADFRLSDSLLSVTPAGSPVALPLRLANIDRAFLTGGAGDNAFDVSGWTRQGNGRAADSFGGKLDGGTGNDTLLKTAPILSASLSDTLLSSDDQMKVVHTKFEDAHLTRGAVNGGTLTGGGVFNLQSWRGEATIGGGSDDTARVNLSGRFTQAKLENTPFNNEYELRVDGRLIRLLEVGDVNLVGDGGNQTVTFDVHYLAGATFQGAGGNDRVVIAPSTSETDFVLSDGKLVWRNDQTHQQTISLAAVEAFTFTGGPGNNTFDLSGWNGGGKINGSSNGLDHLTIGVPGSVTLSSNALVRGTQRIDFSHLDHIQLQGTAAANAIVLDRITTHVSIDGGGGNDALTVRGDGSFDLSGGLVQLGLRSVNFANVEALTLSGASNNLPNRFVLRDSSHAGLTAPLTVAGRGGNDEVVWSARSDENIVTTSRGITGTSIFHVGEDRNVLFPLGDVPEKVTILDGAMSNATFVNFPGAVHVEDIISLSLEGYTNFKLTAPGELLLDNRKLTFTTADGINLLGGAGPNTFTVNEAFAGNGILDIRGAGGNDTLTLITPESTNVYDHRAEFLRSGGTHTINLDQIERVNVTGTAAAQTFQLLGTAAYSLNGAGGNDTLLVSRNADMRLTNVALQIGPTVGGQTWSLQNVERVELTGGAADNLLDAAAFRGTAVLRGEGGNDRLLGGSGNDLLFGGEGHDWLSGLAGNDTLSGGEGSDLLSGGDGVDALDGNGGDDVLIGGRTQYDSNRVAMAEFIAKWSTKSSFTTGVNLLQGGFAAGGTTYRLSTATVTDDARTDQLVGNTGIDWFFAKLGPSTALGLENPDDAPPETAAIVEL